VWSNTGHTGGLADVTPRSALDGEECGANAAVLGREFGYPLLAATAGMDEAALRHGLARLVDAEILFARGEPPAATYTFKHALIQETAYQSLLSAPTVTRVARRSWRSFRRKPRLRGGASPATAPPAAWCRSDRGHRQAGEQAAARLAYQERVTSPTRSGCSRPCLTTPRR
jgi:hypothetical protein